jgi:hypothetical protein
LDPTEALKITRIIMLGHIKAIQKISQHFFVETKSDSSTYVGIDTSLFTIVVDYGGSKPLHCQTFRIRPLIGYSAGMLFFPTSAAVGQWRSVIKLDAVTSNKQRVSLSSQECLHHCQAGERWSFPQIRKK